MTRSKELLQKIEILEHEDLDKESSLENETNLRNLKKPQIDSIYAYTGPGHISINKHLRGLDEPRGSYYQDAAKDLKKVTNHKTSHDFHVYRGILHKNHSEFNIGDEIHDKGFTSTTLNSHQTAMYAGQTNGTKFKIHITPGTKGAYVAHHSKYLNEKEFIVHPGTTFKVHSKETDDKGNTLVHLKIHSQGRSK